MKRLSAAAILIAMGVGLLGISFSHADTVWVTQWATDRKGEIDLFDASGNKIGSKKAPPLAAGGTQIDMTASGLWRMDTDKGPIFFEFNSVRAFTKDNESSCTTTRDKVSHSGASPGFSNSDCQHHP
jgi:hypothetical protein